MLIIILYALCHPLFFSLPLDVSCQIWGARGSSLSVGGVKPANLFLGNDIRNPVSGASLQDTEKTCSIWFTAYLIATMHKLIS